MKKLTIVFLLALTGPYEPARATEQTMYVTGDNLNVRLCASGDCCVTRRLNKNEQVPVFEEKGDWSRISVFYDASAEPKCDARDGLVAQWVASRFLSYEPPEGYDPNEWFGPLADRRIRGIPKVGDYGLTRQDVELIRRYAAHLLASEECDAIEAGNKSVSRDDTYYVYCAGDNGQRFFTAADIAIR